jgi:hypothetical protein
MDNQIKKNNTARQTLSVAMKALRDGKPTERSEISRRYAITITELEKVMAYFGMFVIDDCVS